MRYIRQHITAIIAAYDGSVPLAHFLKNYFRQHPKLGSRDRRMLNTLAYSWYRCSKAINNVEWFETLIDYCIGNSGSLASFSLSDWLNEQKINAVFEPENLFPFATQLSDGINKNEWLHSILTQPDLFIRLCKPASYFTMLLDDNNISYKIISDTCLALPNNTKLEGILPPDSYAVQDASSQKTGTFFHPQKGESWYDCCCASGGKSLLLKDIQPDIELTVSDVRESIIANLGKRFRQYHYAIPQTHVVNVADADTLAATLKNATFDNIICDAPCSGSGTWARTPEQLFFFKPDNLEKFTALQKSIAVNVSHYLKPGGRLFYITCSVFREENEAMVQTITEQTHLRPDKCNLINGISIQADSMFIAVFEKKPV